MLSNFRNELLIRNINLKNQVRKSTSILFPKVLKVGREVKALRNFFGEYL